MQGTRNNTQAGGAVDLDALLAERLLRPASVKVGGRSWKVRTNLTGREVLRCLAFIRTTDFEGVFTYLLGDPDEIAALDDALEQRLLDEKAAADATARGAKAEVTYSPLPYAKKAVEFTALLESLPRMHSALVQAHVYRASKALAEWALDDETIHQTYDYTPGES